MNEERARRGEADPRRRQPGAASGETKRKTPRKTAATAAKRRRQRSAAAAPANQTHRAAGCRAREQEVTSGPRWHTRPTGRNFRQAGFFAGQGIGMAGKRLGEILLAAGAVTSEALEQALAQQSS